MVPRVLLEQTDTQHTQTVSSTHTAAPAGSQRGSAAGSSAASRGSQRHMCALSTADGRQTHTHDLFSFSHYSEEE